VFVALPRRALGLAGDTAGSAACVSLCPLWSHDSFAAPSTPTSAALHGGIRGCNSVDTLETGESAARILSRDTNVFADGALPIGRVSDSWLNV
jgi:hypothetical protein